MVSINLLLNPGFKTLVADIKPNSLRYVKKEMAKDCFTTGKRLAENFNPRTGAKLPISEAKKLGIVGKVTSDKEEQKLLLRMLENESVVVTEAVEKQVMRNQYLNFFKENPGISKDKIYIYSPMPKNLPKSYTRSGQIFAETNNISKEHIKLNFDEIPEDAVVFMPDDCSISGASMIFDLLEKLPTDFKGKLVFAPTVKASGNNLNGDPLAQDVLELMTKINTKGVSREAITEKLQDLISDGKKTNIEALNKIRESGNYKNLDIQIAEGSLTATNFRETATFLSMNKNEQRLVDALFTMSGFNKGYHDSGVMVLLPNKTPNNNVGIMDLVGEAMGLKVKPNGMLTYSENLELRNQGKKCVLGLLPAANDKGNFSKIICEDPVTKKITQIPYDSKKDTHLDILIKQANGEIVTIKYSPKREIKDEISKGRLFGFEIPDLYKSVISTLKGHYQPRTSGKKHEFGHYVDTLNIPNDAEVLKIGNTEFKDIA